MILKKINIPGESFGLKFIPNQSEIFLIIPDNLYPRQINPNLCNPNKSNQSELIRINPNFQSE